MKLKKLLCIALAMIVSVAAFGGCAGGGSEDDGTTKVYIAMYDGGFGVDWMDDVKEEFETRYANTSLEDGKMGLTIDINTSKSHSGDGLASNMSLLDRDIYVTNNFNIYNQYAREGYFLEITDIVKATVPGEDKSIEGKLNQSYKDWFNIDGKYYAIPHAAGAMVITYDKDIFEAHDCYFDKNGAFVSNYKTKKNDANKNSWIGTGPDGEVGTYDDGLPVTYADFYKVCNRLAGKGVIPLFWSGQLRTYVAGMMMSLFTDYEGYDKSVSHFNLRGNIDVINSFTGSKPNITQMTLENDTQGNNVFKQPGLYYALEFMHEVISHDNWYDVTNCFGSADHLSTQESYIYSSPAENKDDIAMLVEGVYWYNEAKGALEDSAETYGSQWENRNFAVLPFPKADATKVGQQTHYDSNQSAIFINSKIDQSKVAIAKEIVQYIFTNKMLSKYTASSSTLLPYDYTVSDEDYATMSNFGKSVYDSRSTTTYVYGPNQNLTLLKNPALTKSTAFWQTASQNNPISAFYNNSGMTAKDYFEALSDYYNNIRWSGLVGGDVQ